MCMYVCIYTYIHQLNCVNRLQQTAQLVGCFIRNTYIYIYIYINIYIYIYAYICIYIYIYIYVYIYIRKKVIEGETSG